MLRSIITSALLAVAIALVGAAPAVAQQQNPFPDCKTDIVHTLDSTAEPIPERPEARRQVLKGSVRVVCDDTTLFADEVVWETDTGTIRATGNVALQQPSFAIFAERAALDGKTKLGTFFVASGWARLGDQPEERSLFGTMEPDVMFRGEEVAKTGPETYRIKGGAFTTCVQPTPRWEMSGSSGTIHLDRYVLLRNVVLRVKAVPLLYLPAVYYPINKEDRSTGFLLPTYGSSTLLGTSLSNAFFWAMGRSHDATFYHDWYTKAGQGYGTEYRFMASPDSRGNVTFHLMREREQLGPGDVVVHPAARSYQLDADINQGLPNGFRLLGRANYFNEVSAQQLNQNIFEFSRPDRSFSASLSGNIGRLRLTATADQRDIFNANQPGQRTGRRPSFNLAMGDRQIGRSPVYIGGSADATYFVRQPDVDRSETDQSLWRFDGGPNIRAALSSLPFLRVTGSASWRFTRWLETIDPVTRQQVSVPLNRQMFNMRAQVTGPTVQRVFLTPNNGYADAFKHVIDPYFSIDRTSHFDARERVLVFDSVDLIVGGVTTLSYGINNRLMARRVPAGSPAGTRGQASEILSVDISQSYYTNPAAASVDPNNATNGSVYSPPGTFSPLRVTAVARPADRTTAQFRMEIDAKYRAIRTLGASGTMETGAVQLTAGWTKWLVIPGLPGFSDPTRATHALNASTSLRTYDNRIGGTYGFNYDVLRRTWLQQRIVAYYNTQCCGVAFDWQSISTPLLGLPSDRRFGVSFTLAGIGSFSNPFGSFGGR
jgi:LPS-assembly protein